MKQNHVKLEILISNKIFQEKYEKSNKKKTLKRSRQVTGRRG